MICDMDLGDDEEFDEGNEPLSDDDDTDDDDHHLNG